tara:strand:+ start:250 stop:492 length:243 start_codon:yes stop_codon:yes gene_type:complete
MSENKEIYKNALEEDKSGNWEKAHELIQDLPTNEAAWIHAYLHRKEGDVSNAGYWYRRAGKDFFSGSLEKEWETLWIYFS